jgi:hypothetical protein
MPHIADTMDGIDTRLLDAHIWQRLGLNAVHNSELFDNYDLKEDKRTNPRDQLRSFVAKYLGDKLAKRLKISMTYLPWSEIKAEDIINWPPDVEFGKVNKMNTNDVKKIYALAKDDQLDFSPGLISRLGKRPRKSRTPEYQVMVKDIQTALCNKLNAGTERYFRRVPWAMLKKEDIINWPEGIPLIRLSQHTMNRLKLLHKLRNEIFFSEEFLKKISDPRLDATITRYIRLEIT